MKKCSPECPGPVCDFCIHYDFNGEDDFIYTGDGYCNHFNEGRDPGDGGECDAFVCRGGEKHAFVSGLNQQIKDGKIEIFDPAGGGDDQATPK